MLVRCSVRRGSTCRAAEHGMASAERLCMWQRLQHCAGGEEGCALVQRRAEPSPHRDKGGRVGLLSPLTATPPPPPLSSHLYRHLEREEEREKKGVCEREMGRGDDPAAPKAAGVPPPTCGEERERERVAPPLPCSEGAWERAVGQPSPIMRAEPAPTLSLGPAECPSPRQAQAMGGGPHQCWGSVRWGSIDQRRMVVPMPKEDVAGGREETKRRRKEKKEKKREEERKRKATGGDQLWAGRR